MTKPYTLSTKTYHHRGQDIRQVTYADGYVGGWVVSEANLPEDQNGRVGLISAGCIVCDNAIVESGSMLLGNITVLGKSLIKHSDIFGKYTIHGADVNHCVMQGRGTLSEVNCIRSNFYGNVTLSGDLTINYQKHKGHLNLDLATYRPPPNGNKLSLVIGDGCRIAHDVNSKITFVGGDVNEDFAVINLCFNKGYWPWEPGITAYTSRDQFLKSLEILATKVNVADYTRVVYQLIANKVIGQNKEDYHRLVKNPINLTQNLDSQALPETPTNPPSAGASSAASGACRACGNDYEEQTLMPDGVCHNCHVILRCG